MPSPLSVSLVGANAGRLMSLQALLSDRMACSVFHSATDVFAALNQQQPDLLMIDLSDDWEDGFRLHRALREDLAFADLYQFVLCSPDAVGKEGFQPDDFVVTPWTHGVLEYKLNLLDKVFEDRESQRAQLSFAQHVAFTSMSAMGELGVVMQFLSKSFACHTVQSVAALAVEALRQYELEGVVYLTWDGDEHALATQGEGLPVEHGALIRQHRNGGRLIEMDRHLVVNFPHVTVLITSMPLGDSERQGRIRDNIATLAEGVESRVQGLLLEHDNLLKQQSIRYAISEIRDSVIDLAARQASDLMHTRALVNLVIDDFEESFLHMGLHSEYEHKMISDLLNLRQKLGEIVGTPREADEKLKAVTAALQTVAGEMPQ